MIDALDLEYKQLKRTRRVNGERIIEFDVFPTKNNKEYFDLVVEEAVVTFDSDEYVIKKVTEKSIGNTYFKQITAIHKFYVDLINKQQYDVHNGSITFNNYMRMVFEDTPYANFETIDNFPAREFENLGDDNRLALLQKGLDRFKAEMELVGSGYKPRFRKMIGQDTDFQFRFGHNIKAISRDIDTTNLATYIRGYGDPELDVFAEYTSPNAAIFGILDAPTVRDERFKSNSAMLNEIKSRLQDEPLVSITIDFVDLRAAGYPYAVPNEGDRVWLIYEPMDDLLIETRILEIVEVFNKDGKVIKSEVTLSNRKKTFAGTMFDNIRKQLSDIVDEDGIVRYSVLDDAVKVATEALQSAQTELEFVNGIIAREKTDPNRVVVLNSAGLGISKDGGNTFTEAITADGFVLTAGAIGRLGANHIQIGPETLWENPNLALNTDIPVTDENVFLGFLYPLDITPSDLRIGDKFVLEFDCYVFGEGLKIGVATHGFDPVENDYIAPPETMDTFGRHTFEITVSNIPDGDNLFVVSENVHHVDMFIISNLTLKRADYTGDTVPEWLDNKLLVDLRLETPLPTSITMNQDGITAYTTHDPNAYARLDHRGLYIKGGAIQIDGGLPDSEIENAEKWNRQGTFIDQTGVYTGKVVADQIVGGSIEGEVFIGGKFEGTTFLAEKMEMTEYGAHHKRSRFDSESFYNEGIFGDISAFPGLGNYVEISGGLIEVGVLDGGMRGAGVTISNAGIAEDGPDGVFKIDVGHFELPQVLNTTTTNSANVYIHPSRGQLYRTSSSAKYKLVTEPINVDYYRILKIIPKNWYDKNNTEKYAELLSMQENGEEVVFDCEKIARIPGLVAEDVQDAGLKQFVIYGENGEVEGLMYDRLWTLLIPITDDHENRLNQYDAMFDTLENRLDKLENELNKLKGAG